MKLNGPVVIIVSGFLFGVGGGVAAFLKTDTARELEIRMRYPHLTPEDRTLVVELEKQFETAEQRAQTNEEREAVQLLRRFYDSAFRITPEQKAELQRLIDRQRELNWGLLVDALNPTDSDAAESTREDAERELRAVEAELQDLYREYGIYGIPEYSDAVSTLARAPEAERRYHGLFKAIEAASRPISK